MFSPIFQFPKLQNFIHSMKLIFIWKRNILSADNLYGFDNNFSYTISKFYGP